MNNRIRDRHNEKDITSLIIAVAIITFTNKKYLYRTSLKTAIAIYSPLMGCPKTQFNGETSKYYSQAYEDYVLSYVFADVPKGFYVDVGANNPNGASATKYFHLQGWKGMNFEPLKNHYDELLQYRSEDININKAVSDTEGKAIFYIPTSADVLASLKEEIVSQIPQDVTSKEVMQIPVEVTTLTKEFKEHNIQDIDFIKIDVEGYEDKVVAGLDFNQYRPKVVVLEYCSPTDQKGYLKFHPIMIKNNYILGTDDSLNYYYYRKESPEFAEKFSKMQKCVSTSLVSRGYRPLSFMFEQTNPEK